MCYYEDDYSKFKKVEDTFVADINYASLVENTINMGGNLKKKCKIIFFFNLKFLKF